MTTLLGAWVFAISASAPSSAQIVAPLLEKHAIEGGYAYKWFDRDFPAPLHEAAWEVASFFGRFGAFDWLTLSAEWGLWNLDDGAAPDQPYTRWVIGAGATAPLYRAPRWHVVATVAYNEVYDHDGSKSRFDKRTRGWNVGVLAATSIEWSGQRVELWAGPMFVDDVVENYAWGLDEPITSEPDVKFGGAAGAYAVLFDYISGFAYVLHADHPQLRLGVSMRSRGRG